MRLLVLLLLVTVPLAGCLDLFQPRLGGYTAAELADDFETGDSLTISLEDFPTGENALLLELVAEWGTTFQSMRWWSFPFDDGTHVGTAEVEPGHSELCMRYEGPFQGGMRSINSLGANVRTNAAGEVLHFSTDPRPGRFTDSDQETVGWNSGDKPGRLLMALADADAWKAAGAQWTIALESDRPFYWRFVDSPGFQCAFGPSGFDGGLFVDTGWYIRAEGMERLFQVAGHGDFLAFIASTQVYDVRLVAEDGTELRRITDSNRFSMSFSFFFNQVPPGEYTVHLDRFEGVFHPLWVNMVVVSLIDWPDPVIGAL